MTDLVVGRRAPRTDAIALGEKLRKEHAKVKKREKEEKAKISKVPALQREAARLAWAACCTVREPYDPVLCPLRRRAARRAEGC